jgi:sirohydrochlorin ferrochelatase
MSTLLLIDNGSTRRESTLNLRRLAKALSDNIGRQVYPVSLMHSDRIAVTELDGEAARIFEPFLIQRLSHGEREFIIVPLFFGPSRALTRFIPEQLSSLHKEFGPFSARVAKTLCPLPEGEIRLAGILYENLLSTAEAEHIVIDRVILVDHGSPVAEVTAVREWIAAQLQRLLGSEIPLSEAVMERRSGSEYDFNGALLEDVLRDLARKNPAQNVVLSMMFFSPGRHAGPGGDIEEIYRKIETEYPGFRVFPTPLVGTHPDIIKILQDRLEQELKDT